MAEPNPVKTSMLQQAGAFVKTKSAFGAQQLLGEGTMPRLSMGGKLLLASQIGYSSWIMLKESITGSTWADISTSIKNSLFTLENIGKPMLKDGGNHGAAWAIGIVMVPSLITGTYKEYDANVENLEVRKSEKTKGDHGEVIVKKYEATSLEKMRVAGITFLDRIPSLFLTAYAITVATKTDLATAWIAVNNSFSTLKGDEARKVMDALSYMPTYVWGTALGVYGMWKSGGFAWNYFKKAYKNWEAGKKMDEFKAKQAEEAKAAKAKPPAETAPAEHDAAAAEFEARLGDGLPAEAPVEEVPAGPQVAVNTDIAVTQNVEVQGPKPAEAAAPAAAEKPPKAPKTTKPRKTAGRRVTIPEGYEMKLTPIAKPGEPQK